MNADKDTEKRFQELQILEQQVQTLLMERQQSQIEIHEAENALEELKKAQGDVFRVLNGIMIKAEKNALTKEIEEKRKIADVKIKAIEKREAILQKSIGNLREELQKNLAKK